MGNIFVLEQEVISFVFVPHRTAHPFLDAFSMTASQSFDSRFLDCESKAVQISSS